MHRVVENDKPTDFKLRLKSAGCLIAYTRQVAEALRTIGVRLVDHIVVADRDFVSMADSGDLLG